MPLLCFALVAALGAEPLSAGDALTYRGNFAPVQEDGKPAKSFELKFFAIDAGDLGWTLSESGRGAWSWPERFGILAGGKVAASDAPSLLVKREEGRYPAPLLLPVLSRGEPLTVGAKWTEGKLEVEVLEETRRGERACFEVQYRSPIGHKRTCWIEKDSGLIVELRETVFMGPGQQHELLAKLVERSKLDADERELVAKSFASWTAFRQTLNREPQTEKPELTAAQIELVKAVLPQLKANSNGPFAALYAAAEADAKQQKERDGALAALSTAAVGKSLDGWELKDLAGKNWSAAGLADKVVVLHFWEYRAAPLEEPYGQIAYLDFLKRRLNDKAVVVGVHVDPRAGAEETRRAAVATARKLRDFMNLTYPIVVDDGALLKRVGDPRVAGGKLPLFVVIGRDGKVVAYHPGLFKVERDRGLADLESIVTKALSP